MYNIDWTSIKDGAKDFEKLARDYVKDVFSFPYGQWEKTSDTHDGNKDAYTIIIGYQPQLSENEVWWMEAKYSTERIYLSRFKLDATIVSSIFNRSVKKIIFVTNIDIKAKVISDIRTALYKGTSCQEAHFCTRKALEFWLYKNPDIYKTYFNNPLPITVGSTDLFVSEDINIYSALNKMRDVSSLNSIVANKLYEAHFKIVSNCNQIVTISSARRGIKRVSSSRIDIQSGENAIAVQFLVKDIFFEHKKYSYDGTEENDLCLFKINKKIPVIAQHALSFLKNEKTQIKIASQMKFEENFMKFKIKQHASYWLIDGTTGCGKTTLIQRCTEEKAANNVDYRYISFIDKTNSNNLELVSLIFFIFFPYMYKDDITSEYLETLDIEPSFKKILCDLKLFSTNEQELVDYIEVLLSSQNQIYPNGVQVNSKIIVLDNLELLNKNNLQILFFILQAMQKLPILFILACNSYFIENKFFNMNMSTLAFERYHLELTINDIIGNMDSIFSFTFDITDGVIEYFFPNIIIFNIYISYVIEMYDNINDLDDFILSYIAFKQNYMANEYINRSFIMVSQKHPAAWNVCQEIYNYRNGIPLSNGNQKEVGLLLKYGLIKYNEFNNLIPINDIYFLHYRKKYICISDTSNPIEHIIWELSNTLSPDQLEKCFQKIHDMRCNEEFQTVNYILETVFESSSLDMYKNIWGEELFNLLYYEYTYAAINCNNAITGYDNLQYIYNNIKGASSERLKFLLLEIIFELINCDYNNGKYLNCKKYYKLLNDTFSALAVRGIVQNDPKKNLFWVLSSGYMLLIDSIERNADASINAIQYSKFLLENYPFHYINFSSQFSKTLYIQDWDNACKWQKFAYDAIDKNESTVSKQSLKVEFSFFFTQYLQTGNGSYLKEMQTRMLAAKYNIYSSFRHQLFLYCGLLYILNSIDEADTLFVKDVISLRPIRQKMKGHYYMLLALHFLKHSDVVNAKKYIQKSIETLEGLKAFEMIPIHNSVVLNNIPFNEIRYKFCTSGSLAFDTFYLDPRM